MTGKRSEEMAIISLVNVQVYRKIYGYFSHSIDRK